MGERGGSHLKRPGADTRRAGRFALAFEVGVFADVWSAA